MTATPGTRLLRAGVALSFGHMVMRGARPDADLYDRLGAVTLLACLVVDSRRYRRELAHHHQALKLLTDVVDDLAEVRANPFGALALRDRAEWMRLHYPASYPE